MYSIEEHIESVAALAVAIWQVEAQPAHRPFAELPPHLKARWRDRVRSTFTAVELGREQFDGMEDACAKAVRKWGAHWKTLAALPEPERLIADVPEGPQTMTGLLIAEDEGVIAPAAEPEATPLAEQPAAEEKPKRGRKKSE